MFLLIGDQIRFDVLQANFITIAITVGAMIFARAISIYLLSALSNFLVKSEIPLRDQTVVWWGGLRGSVSIALALSVSVVVPEIDKMYLEYPNLQKFTKQQLREELLAVEADTYGEFVKTGWLNKELSPFLQDTYQSLE